MTELQQEFANALLNINAIRFGQFKLKIHQTQPDAPLSPFYINLRVLQSNHHALGLATQLYQTLIKNLHFDLVAGIPQGASTLGAVLGWQLKMPIILPRGKKKDYGVGGTVDGTFEAGQTVLLVDDLISQGASKIETIQSLEAEGLVVKDVIVLLDREQGGTKELAEKGYTLHSALTSKELFDYYQLTGAISTEKYAEIEDYMKQS